MITSIVATATTLIVAFGAFWVGAMEATRMVDPLSILFALAGIFWFKSNLIRNAFRAGRTSQPGLAQRNCMSGAPIIRGLFIAQNPRSGRSASSDQ